MASLQAGLFIVGKQTPLPLKDVSVKATINGYLVGLDSTLKYSNEGADPVEVVFRFPIEESFAVVGLEAVIAGRRIKAQIKEKEEAKQMYDDALASGFSAALAEEKTGDIFSISLGNLPPKTDAELYLKLAGELPIDVEGTVRFTLPSAVKPRYTPAGSTDPFAALGNMGLGQVQQASAPAVFKFALEVAGEDGVVSVSSPTHKVTTERKEGRVNVTLADSQPLDKDLVILVQYTDPHAPKATAEPVNPQSGEKKFMGSPAIMVNFFPEFKSPRAACEFIFLIDRSGSMDGSFIGSARDTLILFLKSIPPGCHFNIVGFGSRFQFLFPKSVSYNQENLDTAVRHAEGIRADMGGTELLPPLQQIYQQPLLPGLPRQVFVLTDGSVSNTYGCIEEVKKNVKHARCFTFGIGSGASTALVKGLARAGNGTAEFIQSGERMQPKVISSLKRALQPSVTDLSVEFQVPGGYEVLQAPSKPPTIFSGDKTVVYGILKRKDSASQEDTASGTAILKGQILGETIEYSVSFQIPQMSEPQGSFAMPIIHHLAAKSLIQDWQSGEGLKGLPDSTRKEEIIKLSIESSVVSAHTAYIAVDEEQDKPIEGAIKTWDITAAMARREAGPFGFSGFRFGGGGGGGAILASRPAGTRMQSFGMPAGYAGFGAPLGSASFGMSAGYVGFSAPQGYASFGAPPPPPPGGVPMGGLFSRSGSGPPPPPPPPAFGGGQQRSAFSYQPMQSQQQSCGPPPPPAPAPQLLNFGALPGSDTLALNSASSRVRRNLRPSTTDKVSTLVSLQQAEGAWNLDASLASVFSKSLGELESACPVKCEGTVRMLWATVLALVYLEERLAGQRDEWELVAMKAEFWLQGQTLPTGTSIEDLKTAARKCF